MHSFAISFVKRPSSSLSVLLASLAPFPNLRLCFCIPLSQDRGVNVVMETKGGKKKSSSSSSNSVQYEVPLGYSIEDIRPNGGIEKFRSAAYSNCVRMPS
uniref:S-adenosylmethionine decarboxylase proenzyme n=2 Tax=Salix viminalis TaxID=40686 RepID=A0A6N2M2H1_SALVM